MTSGASHRHDLTDGMDALPEMLRAAHGRSTWCSRTRGSTSLRSDPERSRCSSDAHPPYRLTAAALKVRISEDTSTYIFVGMGKRLVDIDDELLGQARKILGAATMKDTVNRSLEEVIRADRRRRHAQRLAGMEGLDLDDEEVMDGAWR